MNLANHIRLEIENNKIGEEFSCQELINIHKPTKDKKYLVGNTEYTKAAISSILSNHSTGPGNRIGDSVKKGYGRLFIKLPKKGRYKLAYEDIDLDEQDPQALDFSSESVIVTSASIANSFVQYIRNKPFRIFLNAKGRRTKRTWLPTSGPALGWLQRLNSYEWNSKNWASTSIILNSFIMDISKIKSMPLPQAHNASKTVYDNIRKWGNPKGVNLTGSQVYSFLTDKWSSKIKIVDSTLTKLYALADPDNFVMYDSRVAAAIVSIAEDIYRVRFLRINSKSTRVDTVSKFCSIFNHLGTYGGTGGTRPRGLRYAKWPYAYASVSAQLQANELCMAIRDQLNSIHEDNKSNWTLREVEAVLFMEGY
jgi:hypothetical protein